MLLDLDLGNIDYKENVYPCFNCLKSDYVLFRFDLYFRRNPFGGEFTVFAGLEECIKLIANFRFTDEEIAFIQASLPASCEV